MDGPNMVGKTSSHGWCSSLPVSMVILDAQRSLSPTRQCSTVRFPGTTINTRRLWGSTAV
ncbi:MAG: hypothetical protein H7832_03030 [Magnetococcus sp. DMHC-6]